MITCELINALVLLQVGREYTGLGGNTFVSTILKITKRRSIPAPGHEERCCRNEYTYLKIAGRSRSAINVG
jgi:hypothetical protein